MCDLLMVDIDVDICQAFCFVLNLPFYPTLEMSWEWDYLIFPLTDENIFTCSIVLCMGTRISWIHFHVCGEDAEIFELVENVKDYKNLLLPRENMFVSNNNPFMGHIPNPKLKINPLKPPLNSYQITNHFFFF